MPHRTDSIRPDWRTVITVTDPTERLRSGVATLTLREALTYGEAAELMEFHHAIPADAIDVHYTNVS